MNLFFSGGPTDRLEYDPRLPKGKRYRLMSCHDEYVRQAHKTTQALIAIGEPFEMMYDSGAFTAWSKGGMVELDDLIRVYDSMLERYESKAEAVWLISLDKIPGSKGRTASAAEIAEAVVESDHNFEILRARYGERVLPVFHQNESTARLREVAAMAPYICVSPRNDLQEKIRRRWAAEVHAAIPGVRTHGLAATSYDMMARVPWTSVDSATWVIQAANGIIQVGIPIKLYNISEYSSFIKSENQHYRTLPKIAQRQLAEYVEARGFTIDGLERNFYDRMMFNRVTMGEASTALAPPAEIAATTPTEIALFDL